MTGDPRERSVFINCPFDDQYRRMFDAMVFAVTFCGFKVRSALEIVDAGELRLQKIMRLIEYSRYSIHDISRVELDTDSKLPRFNMPIELGIAFGMKYLGRNKLRDHLILVLDSEKYRYQKYASDLAGVDIKNHDNEPDKAIKAVRDFLSPHSNNQLPDEEVIGQALSAFEDVLPALAKVVGQNASKLNYVDRLRHISAFIERAE